MKIITYCSLTKLQYITIFKVDLTIYMVIRITRPVSCILRSIAEGVLSSLHSMKLPAVCGLVLNGTFLGASLHVDPGQSELLIDCNVRSVP